MQEKLLGASSDYMVDILKLPNQVTRVSGKSNVCSLRLYWRDTTSHLLADSGHFISIMCCYISVKHDNGTGEKIMVKEIMKLMCLLNDD